MIKLKDVSKIYYNNGVVGTGFSNLSVEFKIGEFVVIVGESGSGKSTLLNVISGLDTYEEGEMFINGEETSHYVEQDFEDYRRKYVANIFQSFNLVNSYTVRQNVELVLQINGHDNKEIKSRVDGILKDVGLWELRNKKATKLSGGQKQRVAIARALAKETPIIIADEPTGNLDSESASQIFELLHKMSKDKLVVVVTHNPEQVEKYATRLIRMHDGHIVEDKKIKKVESSKPQTATHKEMSFMSKYLLSLRNTFNIIPRFLIILGVFLAVSVTVLGEFSSINSDEYKDAVSGISPIFFDTSPERIIVNKLTKEELTDEELKSFEDMDHVEKIIKQDHLLDQYLYIMADTATMEGTIDIIDNFEGEIEKGQLPVNDFEFLMVANKDSADLVFEEDWLDKDGDLVISTDGEIITSVNSEVYLQGKITGYAIDNDLSLFQNKYYMTKNTYDLIQAIYFLCSSRLTLKDDRGFFEESISSGMIGLNDKVSRGHINIPPELFKNWNNQFKNNVNLNIKSFYEEANKKFTLSADGQVDTKYDIEINPKDIYDLIPTKNYQVSLYADNYENVDDIVKLLKDKGYNAISVKDTSQVPDVIVKLYDFINYIGIGFILIALFFVSYFVISLVLKSKTTYYAVVRILGGNQKLNKTLINLELFNSVTIAFVVTLILCLLSYNGIINIKSLNDAIKFLKPVNFIVLYIVMVVFSQLLAHKYSKKIFKDSMINTYNREI